MTATKKYDTILNCISVPRRFIHHYMYTLTNIGRNGKHLCDKENNASERILTGQNNEME